MNLKSIAEEEADCRAAFVGIAVGAFVLHCHHNSLLEVLTEPAENRINYILCDKPEVEQALRLRLFRPVSPEHTGPELDKAYAEWDKAYAELDKARAEWDKACKAYAEWGKAGAEWDKARAELDKARAEWDKAYAEWGKARAEWDKARAEWDKAGHHAAICPGCPWLTGRIRESLKPLNLSF